MNNPLLSEGYTDFLLGKRDEYEDDVIKAMRHADGSCEITGKPIKDIFIYALGDDVL